MNDMFGEPGVRYSETQLAMLATLGLVPWVRRAGAPTSTTAIEPTEVGTLPVPAPVAAPETEPDGASAFTPASPGTDAAGARATSQGALADRALVGFARRGERRFDTGPDDAEVLVLAEPVPDAGTPDLLPLAPADADLLQAMLRAIDLGPGRHATALLAAASAGGQDAPDAPVVADRLAGRRVVIWLCHDASPAESSGSPDDTLDGVPLFRVAHPAVLRARPLAKRDAWRTLKRVRARLSTPVGGRSASPGNERR